MADKIQFVNVDPDQVVSDLVTKYESLTGRTLQPAQAERIVFDAIGYRLSLVLNALNETANKCFVQFADGAALEYLGELVGVKRLPASPSTCTLRATLVSGHGDLNIPSGIRVQSIDGQAVFITIESKSVDSSTNTVDIKAECIDEGIVGNGYAIGDVSVVLDPQPYISSFSNLEETANGSDAETDEELRDRIILAPSQFSVAGPKGAYKFFAKSAHPNIIDVAVTIGHETTSPFAVIPGQVDIFPLMVDGTDPDTEIIDAILSICNDDKIRPLTDTVVVKAPVKIDYSLSVQLTLLTDAVQQDVIDKVTENLEAYRDYRKTKLGIDVVRSQITAACQIDGVYKVNVVSPASDIVVNESSFSNCTGIAVTAVATSDE